MLRYELSKIRSTRYTCLLLLALLLLNGILTLTMNTGSKLTYRQGEDTLKWALENPEEFEKAYADYQERIDRAVREWQTLAMMGVSDAEIRLPENQYADAYGMTDGELFEEILQKIDSAEGIFNRLESVIQTAREKLGEYDREGLSPDAYLYRYQRMVEEQYSILLREIQIGYEFSSGWQAFFQAEGQVFLLLASVFLLSFSLFSGDIRSGFVRIAQISRKGRVHNACARLGALSLSVFAVTLLFFLESLLIIGWRTGFSSICNAIQILPVFALTPQPMTIGEGVLCAFLFRLLAAEYFALTVAGCGLWIRHPIPSVLLQLIRLGLHYLAYSYSFIEINHPLKLLNLFSASLFYPLFDRLRPVNVLGRPIPAALVCVLLLLFLAVVSVVLILAKCRVGIHAEGMTRFRKRTPKDGTRSLPGRIGIPPRKERKPKTGLPSLFGAEVHKMLVLSFGIAVILLGFGVKAVLLGGELRQPIPFSEELLKSMTAQIAGEATEEKKLWLREERTRIDDILARFPDAQESFDNGSLSYPDYEDYLRQYTDAVARDPVLRQLTSHMSYIEKQKSRGREAWFVFDEGWESVLSAQPDWILYAMVLFLSGVFACEFSSYASESGFSVILRTTARGRDNTFFAKYRAVSSSVLLVFLVRCALLWTGAVLRWGLPLGEAPIQSIEAFGDVTSQVKIGEFCAFTEAVRLLSLFLLAVDVCSLSCLFRQTLPVAVISATAVCAPSVVEILGVGFLSFLDPVSILSGTPILMDFYRNGGIALIPAAVWFAVSALLFAAAYRRWCRGNRFA